MARGRMPQPSICWIRKVMHLFKGKNGHRTKGVPSRKRRHALHEVDEYLSSRSPWLVNYADR